MAALLKRALADSLRQFSGMKPRELLDARHTRLLAYGRFKNTTEES
jgi:acetyl-CoA carboxylase carboxyl transferase subunit alpha